MLRMRWWVWRGGCVSYLYDAEDHEQLYECVSDVDLLVVLLYECDVVGYHLGEDAGRTWVHDVYHVEVFASLL